MNEYDQIRKIKERAEAILFRIPGVHGVGVGHKNTHGAYTGELSIKVYVNKKKPLPELAADEVIPREIEGIKTDVVESGPPELHVDPDTAEWRPARGGTCIQIQEEFRTPGEITIHGHIGTMGCIAKTTGNPSILVGITNHHVLSFDGVNLPKGKAVGQSSPTEYSICSKCCSEIIGVVLDGINNLAADVALVKLNRKLEFFREVKDEPQDFLITGTYSLQTSGIPASPYHVKKRGQKTRLTKGTIDSVSTTFTDQATNTITHTNIISIKPDAGLFSDVGDSGSVVVSNEGGDTGKVVGLLFGGNSSSGFGFACDIDVVKAQLAGIHLPIDILTATSLGDKQTVPDTADQANAYMVAAGQEEFGAPAPVDLPLVQKIEAELSRTESGKNYVELFRRHHAEVRALIDTNKRVATIWHRNGGPSLLQSILRVIRFPDSVVPTDIGDSSLMECVGRLAAAFKRYGSATLARDITEYGAVFARLGGQNYRQMLQTLTEPAGFQTGFETSMKRI